MLLYIEVFVLRGRRSLKVFPGKPSFYRHGGEVCMTLALNQHIMQIHVL